MFRLEREMTPIASAWMAERGLTVRREFETPWGSCDLLGVQFDEERVKNRLSHGQRQAIGPQERVRLLHRIPEEKAITQERLAMLMGHGETPEDLAGELNVLVSRRFVVSPRAGQYRRINGWDPLSRNIVAVELKLTRITDALAQATSNQLVADESYVGLPGDTAERVLSGAHRAVFEERGVGLLHVTRDRCTVCITAKPQFSRHQPPLRTHLLERFWRQRSTIGTTSSAASRPSQPPA
jgi:hypothetical protein